MKLITLRIDAEEKARLEQLAEERNVTLSRALREGASLYLGEVREKVHRARGGEATFLGVRRDNDGRNLDATTEPTPGERRKVAALRRSLYERGLASVREAWVANGRPGIVLGALAHWLSLVGQIYGSNPGEPGWDAFLRDYCPEYQDRDKRAELRRTVRGGLLLGTRLNVGEVVETLDRGFLRFLDDAEHQDLVRRAVLPAWAVLERSLHG